MSAAAYNRARGGKLTFKGGLEVDKVMSKKRKKKKPPPPEGDAGAGTAPPGPEADGEEEEEAIDGDGGKRKKGEEGTGKGEYEPDGGTGFAPDGKSKSKKYEELFPVETKRFGYRVPDAAQSREDALLERVKKKADKFCK